MAPLTTAPTMMTRGRQIPRASARPPPAVRVRAYDSKDGEASKAPTYPNLFNRLLSRAATRLDRGETHCLHCKGTGIVECHTCQGAGVIAPEKVKVNMMRRAGSAIKQQMSNMMHEEGNSFDFQITNRCRSCHGTGGETCRYCEGTGRRGKK